VFRFRPCNECWAVGHLEVSEVLERHVPGSAFSSARPVFAVAASYFVADTILNEIALLQPWKPEFARKRLLARIESYRLARR
jgi:hypothetical protein